MVGTAVLKDTATNLFLNVLASNPMLFDRFYNVTDTLGVENADLRPLTVCWIWKFKDLNSKSPVLTKFKLVAAHLCSSLMVSLKECKEWPGFGIQ